MQRFTIHIYKAFFTFLFITLLKFFYEVSNLVVLILVGSRNFKKLCTIATNKVFSYVSPKLLPKWRIKQRTSIMWRTFSQLHGIGYLSSILCKFWTKILGGDKDTCLGTKTLRSHGPRPNRGVAHCSERNKLRICESLFDEKYFFRVSNNNFDIISSLRNGLLKIINKCYFLQSIYFNSSAEWVGVLRKWESN